MYRNNIGSIPKLDLKEQRTRTPSPAIGTKSYARVRYSRGSAGMTRQSGRSGGRFAKQLMVCMSALLVIMIMQISGGVVSTTAIDGIDHILDTPSEIQEMPGKLKFISALFDDTLIETSTGVAEEYVFPLAQHRSFAVVSLDGEDAMEFTGCEELPVWAVKDGHVFYVGNSELGSYIRVNHDDGSYALYYGAKPQVKAGEAVLAGQPIAHVEMNKMYVQIMQDRRGLVPESYGA